MKKKIIKQEKTAKEIIQAFLEMEAMSMEGFLSASSPSGKTKVS